MTLRRQLSDAARMFEQMAELASDETAKHIGLHFAEELRKRVSHIEKAILNEQGFAGVNDYHFGASDMLAYLDADDMDADRPGQTVVAVLPKTSAVQEGSVRKQGVNTSYGIDVRPPPPKPMPRPQRGRKSDT